MGATTGGGMLAMTGMAGGRPSMGSMMSLATSRHTDRRAQHPLKLGSTLAAKGEAGGVPHDAGGCAGQQADLPADAGAAGEVRPGDAGGA